MSGGSKRVTRARLRGALRKIMELSWDADNLADIRQLAEAALTPGALVETFAEHFARRERERREREQQARIAKVLDESKARRDAAFPGFTPAVRMGDPATVRPLPPRPLWPIWMERGDRPCTCRYFTEAAPVGFKRSMYVDPQCPRHGA